MLHVFRASSVVALVVLFLFCRAASADGSTWRALLDEDPGLKRDATADSNGNPGYATVPLGRGGVAGAYDGPATVRTGSSEGARLVAIPLDSGGSIGYAGWLIFRSGFKKHIAVLSGSSGLTFRHGDLITDDVEGDSPSGNAARTHHYVEYRYKGGTLRRVAP